LNRDIYHKILILLLAVISAAFFFTTQKPEVIVVFALGAALLLNVNKSIFLKGVLFTAGLYSSITVFGYSPIIALFIFEIVRLVNKGFKNLNDSLFALVPIVTLAFASFGLSSNSSNYLIYYFTGVFTLMFIDFLRGEKDWPSLIVISSFMLGSHLEVLSLTTFWVILIYGCYIIVSKLFQKYDSFLSYICLSTFGFISLSITNQKIFSYLIISLAIESLAKAKKIRNETLMTIYVFTLFLFAREYFETIQNTESLYPIMFILFPLFSKSNIVVNSKSMSFTKVDNIKTLLTILAYVLGVLVYAY
jgi:hypothetical protein